MISVLCFVLTVSVLNLYNKPVVGLVYETFALGGMECRSDMIVLASLFLENAGFV